MRLFAIGDLHLAHSVAKPMSVFDEKWTNHTKRLQKEWSSCVTDEDVVIICGDISWGMRLEEAMEDLSFIERLPGKKVCIRGNHDYWWHKINYMNTLFETIYFLQNTAYVVGDYVICGTRGWTCPVGDIEDDSQRRIYDREGIRLELSLKQSMSYPNKKKIVALHYPPTNSLKEPSLFTGLLTKYQVDHVVYGHLHHEDDWASCIQGEYKGALYHLVAADYLAFKPKLIHEA